ncbi:hypothetical protein DH2020_046446 [Rehmannia glutinosa]|uniref:hydroxymethylglutaryl-CoA lyase n=1 Tax=Rehmannia glutinosa TaxID=99300 RepID=A0ABR0UBY5_REHGL
MSSLEEPLGLDKLPSLSNIDRLYSFSSSACRPIREDMGMGNCWIEGRSCSSSNSCKRIKIQGTQFTQAKSFVESSKKPSLFKDIPRYVKIVEVGPRDGLQNEKTIVPMSVKVNLIHKLVSSGLSVVEATSFVSPKWVPQLADAKDVMDAVKNLDGVRLPVLTPNLKGFEAAVAAGAKEVAVFASASESFSKSNINCSIEESFARYRAVTSAAKKLSIPVRGFTSASLSHSVICPLVLLLPQFLGEYSQGYGKQKKVAEASALYLGIGTVLPMLEAVMAVVPVEKLAVHFHDTYGQSLPNILLSLQGCPYAKGASGNVATEDVVYMLNGLGVKTNIDMDKLLSAGEYISQYLGRPSGSKTAVALSRISADASKI